MKLSRESTKHLNRLIESVIRRYNVQDKEQLKQVVQDEISLTLDRVLDSNNLVPSIQDKPELGCCLITGPLNSLADILENSIENKLDIYMSANYYVISPSYTIGDQGERFVNTLAKPEITKVFIGSLNFDGKNYQLIISKELPTSLFDLESYISCWNTSDPRIIKDFLNDIYNRLYNKSVYATDNLLSTPTNPPYPEVSYEKLLACAKNFYPNTVGREEFILKNVAAELAQAPIESVIIDRKKNSVQIICSDKDTDFINRLNRELEYY